MRIDYRWAEGRAERYSSIAAELVPLEPDVIVTGGSAILAPLQATSTVPIVFAHAVDPIRAGFVASLARPGATPPALRFFERDCIQVAGARSARSCRGLRRGRASGMSATRRAVDEMREVHSAATALGVEFDKLEIRRAEDIATAFERLTSGTQALYVCPDRAGRLQPRSHRHPGARLAATRPCSVFGNSSIRQA